MHIFMHNVLRLIMFLVYTFIGINSRTPMDGAFLPYRNGFDYVGTNLPYTNLWSCDENQVKY